jgi:hypothetical protein
MIRIVIEIDEKTQEVHIEQPKSAIKVKAKVEPALLKPKNHHTPVISTKEKICIGCGKVFIPHANRQVRCVTGCGLEVKTKSITQQQIEASQGIPYSELRN